MTRAAKLLAALIACLALMSGSVIAYVHARGYPMELSVGDVRLGIAPWSPRAKGWFGRGIVIADGETYSSMGEFAHFMWFRMVWNEQVTVGDPNP